MTELGTVLSSFLSNYAEAVCEDLKLTNEPKLTDNGAEVSEAAFLDADLRDKGRRVWEVAQFLEDPFDLLEYQKDLVQSPTVKKGLESAEAAKAFISLPVSATNLVGIGSIIGKTQQLVDVKATVVEQIQQSFFAMQSSRVSEWSFFILADETGSIIAAFPPDMPRGFRRGPKDTLKDLWKPGDRLLITNLKIMHIFGYTMLTSSRNSAWSLLVRDIADYILVFGPRGG